MASGSMFDVAGGSAGSTVALATSCDESYPPEAIIDGEPDTFWMSTGMFPQEVIISFQSLMQIKQIVMTSSGIRELRIEKSASDKPIDFEELTTKELENHDTQGLQREELEIAETAMHLRFVILSGFEHFISIHRINVDGTAVR